MKKALILLALSSLGVMSLISPSVAAPSRSVPRYNCLTREVWSPAKQAWCNRYRMNLTNTEWLLEDLSGTGVLDRAQTTLRFDSTNRLTGRGGCNQYFAEFQQQGNAFKVGAIGATKKACSPALMNQETRFFEALQQAQRVRLDGSFLLIDVEGSDQPLRFSRITEKS
ncbi:META domain-containing protein [Leptolyngbya sp. NIES-2104]|uniref:META domain-containing protein n=1 Tax=Leptolyngbya sp. NIES-2104 TaxID=1552121 RepID=UPI0006EC56D7|nr:META domain-containing protein [Leptolyngbya sp. NIES-2104]GAP97004.1 protein of unknown function DUF306 [Leptolyngbya sp. NIES-2104]